MKPIPFNTKMVRAILDERKTCTRRVIKPQPEHVHTIFGPSEEVDGTFEFMCGYIRDGVCYDWIEVVTMPYQQGDILYVRETWRVRDCIGDYAKSTKRAEIEYRAGGDSHIIYPTDPDFDKWRQGAKWHPPIHMPKEAARIFLRVVNVRAERLQDMKEEDAFAEGYEDHEPWCFHSVYENYPDSPIPCWAASSGNCPQDRPCDHTIPELFGTEVWDGTIKKKDLDVFGWNANPWVWVIEFERISREEAMSEEITL